MQDNYQRRKTRRLFLLFIVVTVTTVVLIVGVYAWFIGISTVNVSEFNVTISAEGGLELSLTGGDNNDWKSGENALIINKTTVAAASNSNKWVADSGDDAGLIPYSSAGIADSNGNLVFYQKTSLSVSPGGYKITAGTLDNNANGYVAFDMYIRNGRKGPFSGDNYSAAGGESIYMRRNPIATVSDSANTPTASATNDHGAANSLRVAFYEVAGMKSSDAAVSDITALSCTTTNSDTAHKICAQSGADQGVFWHIWEPNHLQHTDSLINYYNRVCKTRDVSTGAYESTACTQLSKTEPVSMERNTYAIRSQISTAASTVPSSDVDIYDGNNGYTHNVYDASTNVSGVLQQMSTYKSPDNSTVYGDNNQLIKLAGNSITKVRVFIWLEGQDIDNYDIISGNQSVVIKFGLTKDRFDLNSPLPTSSS